MIIEDIFKTKEGDREDQLIKLENRIKELDEKLLKIDEMFVNGELEKDSYARLKISIQSEEVNLQSQHSQLKLADTNFMKYCKYGTSLLANLDFYYQEAKPWFKKNYLVRYSLEN